MAAVLGIIKNVLAPTNQLFISLKQNKYWEGDSVEGEVSVISLELPYKAEIELKFKGNVNANVKYANSIRQLRKPIQRQAIKLFEGEITERKQSFSFQFTLPKECQSSFSYQNPEDKGDFVEVNYYAKAKLKVPHRFDQKMREKFEIREKQKKIATPQRAYSSGSPNGLAVWIERNSYCLGERIIVRLDITNNKAKVEQMHMRLVQGIEYLKNGTILHVAEPKVLKISPPPPFYCGITWLEFYIPPDLQPSTLHGEMRLIYFLKFDADNAFKVLLPINILEPQPVHSLHSIPPPTAPLPPPCEIRTPLQSDDIPKCSLCETTFTILKTRSHCRHCGKVFCKSCVNSKVSIPKLRYHEPEKVCRQCVRIVEETGGVKYQEPKKVVEEWSKVPEVQWVPKCSKKDYEWVKTKFESKEFICYSAKDPAASAEDATKSGELSDSSYRLSSIK